MAEKQSLDARLDEIRKTFGGPMRLYEQEWCRNAGAFLECALRNGLTFHLVLSVLYHDMNNFRQGEIPLSAPDKELPLDALRFSPMVDGYAEITEDSVGGPDESGDSQ